MPKYNNARSIYSQKVDDRYFTRNHAFNNALATAAIVLALTIGAVTVVPLPAVWFFKGFIVSIISALIVMAISLLRYTREARDMLWENEVPAQSTPVKSKPIETLDNQQSTMLPHPDHKRGNIFVSVALTQSQLLNIAKAARKHGKITVNALIGFGIARDQAERLREEFAAHGLVYFDERNQAVVTDGGRHVFQKILTQS